MLILSELHSVFKSLFTKNVEAKWRMPERVSRDDWYKKIHIHGRLNFTEKDDEFFKIFTRKNRKYFMINHHINEITILNTINYNDKRIIKLDDEWYLISNGDHSYYICDEFEEVLGYLSSNGFNI